jgi:MSHA biogenesis protein MshJ
MKLPPAVAKLAARFDALTMRERALVVAASMAAIVMLWTLAILDPISGKLQVLEAEKVGLESQIAAAVAGIDAANVSDPTSLALAKEQQRQAQLDTVNRELSDKSAGLIPAERMVHVIHDVLSRQHGVRLVSLHNEPEVSLVHALAPPTTEAATDKAAAATLPTGPFEHPVELVIEGSYLDLLAYLRALEQLEWRFHWKMLDLETTAYPTNRVRIELSTLSMDKDWIGV